MVGGDGKLFFDFNDNGGDMNALEMALEALTNPSTIAVQHAIELIKAELAKPEQKLNDPPSYVEPPTSDYHNGWEEGFEAAKNLFKKESAPQNADPRLLLGRKDNCTALAQPEQEPVAWMLTLPDGTHDWILDGKDCDGYVPLYLAPPKREWVGLTDDEIKSILDCGRGGLVDIKKAEQILKEKNT